jgi:(hydroxyamino)benzene mutase
LDGLIARRGVGAGRKLAPIATGDHQASAAKEGVVSFLLVTLSLGWR